MNQEIIAPGQASDAPTMLAPSTNTAAAMSRQMAEVQAEFKMAMSFPRDEITAAVQLVNSCRRPSFAADAEYKFPRGGSEVSGPSIYLAREAARCWGRIRSGARVLERTDEEILIEAYAVDLQSVRVQTAQARVKNKIQRKQKSGKTEWVEPDERDFSELVNRTAAKLERNCILALIPSDIVEDACKVARDTCRKAAAGELDADRPGQIRALVSAYSEYGVNRPHLEAKLGHPLDAITPAEITDLRAIYRTISSGEKGAADFFDLAPPATASEVKTAASVDTARGKLEELKGGKAKGATPAGTDPSTTPPAAA